MRKQVEALEHEADAAAQTVELGTPHLRMDVPAVEEERPRGDLLQPVDGADQRRLPRPGRAAHHDDLAARDLGVNVYERMVRPILLIHVAEADHGRGSFRRRGIGHGSAVRAWGVRSTGKAVPGCPARLRAMRCSSITAAL